jgi:hypothetical protein
MGFGFAGTATANNVAILVSGVGGAGVSSGANNGTAIGSYANTLANTNTSYTLANASAYNAVVVKGTISVNAGGTFIPQYTLSAAPGGAYTTAAGSFFLIYPIGASGANVNVGTWA